MLYRRCNDQQRRLLNQPSTSRMRGSQTVSFTSPSASSTPSNASGPQQPTFSTQAKGPPTMRVALARRQASRSYSVAFIQALVLVGPLRWS
jgi:hypothetical protein